MKAKQTLYLITVAGAVSGLQHRETQMSGPIPIPRLKTSHATLSCIMLMFLLPCLFGSGCAHGPKKRFKPAWLASQRDVAGYLDLALGNPDADIRRAAVVQIGKTRHDSSAVAMDAMSLIARSDQNSSVRCAAIRVLAQHPGLTATNTMLALLTSPKKQSHATPAGAGVRRAAMRTLSRFSSQLLFEGEAETAVREAGVDHVLHDESRAVRIWAASLLAHHPHIDTARALIDALGQSDFAVVYEADRSLSYLTGQAFECEPGRWRAWLETAKGPFEQGRAMQARRNPPKRPWWQWKRG